MPRSSAGTKLPSARKRRGAPRPWLAALLSVLQSGLGHVYAGNVVEGIGIAVGTLLAAVLVPLATAYIPGVGTLVIVLLMVLTIYVAIPIDAWRRAARNRTSGRPRHPELWIAILVFFVMYSLIAVADRIWLRTRIVEAFRIPSTAMAPTLLDGDWIYALPRRGEPLHAGELAVFQSEGMMLTKRIVALPGDTIAMRSGLLLRNGRTVDEPYVSPAYTTDLDDTAFAWEAAYLADPAARASYRPTLDNWGPLVVPAGRVFVLGDNRHNSRDSRYIGFIPVDAVVAVPTEIYFSWNSDDRAVRWNRIGRRLD